MLTFETTSECDELEIHLAANGFEVLRGELDKLRAPDDHVHLKTEAWAGTELSDATMGANHRLVNHVKIFLWKGST
jgi:hypothetical protein